MATLLQNQPLLEKIPFNRSRKFWVAILMVPLIFSTIIFLQFLEKGGGNYSYTVTQIIDWFNFSYGSALFYLLGYKVSALAAYIALAIYYLLIVFLVYKSFNKKIVEPKYPVLIVALYITGMLTSYLFV